MEKSPFLRRKPSGKEEGKKIKKINAILKHIKSIKIQGARNIAKSALYAYSLNPTKKTKKKLMNARPTEPMLINVLNMLDKSPFLRRKPSGKETGYKKILSHFSEAQEKINSFVLKIVKNKPIIFTHCHSSAVVQALIYAKKKGRNFQVYNTETRPLFQGRKTARELSKAEIKVTTFIDSAIASALEGKIRKKPDFVLLGADAILKKGIINKVGSKAIAELSFMHKIPLYIVADSWKYFPKSLKIEERDFHEVWKYAPKEIKVRNPAFEFVEKKHVEAVISELGILSYERFLRKVEKKKN